MPVLTIHTNAEIRDGSALIRNASAKVADMLGKPESYVMVILQHNPNMLFAGSSEPLAYLELKSIGLAENRCSEYSATLCHLFSNALDIAQDRIYIEFSNAERHLFGWNGGTF